MGARALLSRTRRDAVRGRSCATRRGEGRFASLRGEAGELCVLVALVVIAPHVLVVVVLILVFISGVVVIVVFICVASGGREVGSASEVSEGAAV